MEEVGNGENGENQQSESPPEPPPATPDVVELGEKPEPPPATPDLIIKMLTEEDLERFTTPPKEAETEDES